MWANMEICGLFAFSLMVTMCQARFISAPRQARLSLADPMPYYYHNDIDGHPGTYSYGYDVTDPATGNSQFRTEERYPNGTVVGSYGYLDAWGTPHRYRYIADERGYRVMRDSSYNPYRDSVLPSPYPPFQRPNQVWTPTELNPTGSPAQWSQLQNTVQHSRPENYQEPSVTWTRPSKSNKKKNNNYFVNRPSHNFIGPPSSFSED